VGWLKVDDNFLEHPKFLQAVEEGTELVTHLWFKALSYCRRHLTDGRFTHAALRTFSRSRRLSVAVNALVNSRLWLQTDDGYEIKDYLDWYESREQVEQKKQANTNKIRRWREAKKPSCNQVTEAGVTAQQQDSNPAPIPTPIPIPTPTPTDPPGPLSGGDAPDEAPASRVVRVLDAADQPGQLPGAAPASTLDAPPSRPALERAYVGGVKAATGGSFAFPAKPWEYAAVDDAVGAHGAPRVGAELLAWVTASVTAYVTACRESQMHKSKGFAPTGWLDWLNAGAPATIARPSASPPVQPHDPLATGAPRVKWSSKARNAGGAS
jgi:hypothetical protein